MKVFSHERFHDVYTSDPAAAPGRITAVVTALQGRVDFVAAEMAEAGDILAVHEPPHVEDVKRQGLYEIAALAAAALLRLWNWALSSRASLSSDRPDTTPRPGEDDASGATNGIQNHKFIPFRSRPVAIPTSLTSRIPQGR